MIIHDLNLASEHCVRLILIHNGILLKQGSNEEVFTFQDIEDVYQTLLVTQKNPLSSKPAVFLASGEVLKEIQKVKKVGHL